MQYEPREQRQRIIKEEKWVMQGEVYIQGLDYGKRCNQIMNGRG